MISGYGYQITVQMTSGTWASMGKMDATMIFIADTGRTTQSKVTLQPHMIKIEAGKAYSAIVEAQYPIHVFFGIGIHWRRKVLGGVLDRRSILVDTVTIEPLYLLGHERETHTQVWRSYCRPSVEIKPDSAAFFSDRCT